MSPKTSEEIGVLAIIVLGIWMINGVLIGFLLTRIDGIVNGQLYSFGLQFSNEWASPYWTNLHLIFILVGLPVALSTLVFAAALAKERKIKLGSLIKRKKKPLEIFVEQPAVIAESETGQQEVLVEQDKESKKEEIPVEVESQEAVPVDVIEAEREAKKSNSLLISCPNCNKFFGRPLTILDFSSGKTRLVNICPYCNHPLEELSDENGTKSENQVT